MILDSGEFHLGPGDMIVQQATLHGFINHGTEACVLVAILIDAAGG